MRRALIVGIDHYQKEPLQGCINDAMAMHEVLHLHDNTDKDENFECKVLVSSQQRIKSATLKAEIKWLFAEEAEIALLYFSGHGARSEEGGFLVTQDSEEHNEGVAMDQVMTLAKKSAGR